MTPSAVGPGVAVGRQHNVNGEKLERANTALTGCVCLEISSCDVPDYIGEPITHSAEFGLLDLRALRSKDGPSPTSL